MYENRFEPKIKYFDIFHQMNGDRVFEEIARPMYDALAEGLCETTTIRGEAAEQRISVEVLFCEAVALTYVIRGKEVPGQLKEWLEKNDPRMPSKMRESLLKPAGAQ